MAGILVEIGIEVKIWDKIRSIVHAGLYLVGSGSGRSGGRRWELLGNYPNFTVVMVIYHSVERIWRILITPNFLYNIYDHE